MNDTAERLLVLARGIVCYHAYQLARAGHPIGLENLWLNFNGGRSR